MPSDNKVGGLQEAERRIEEVKRSGSAELDLTNLSLNTIPDSIAQHANLRYLDLSVNQISTIPDSLAQLTNLQSLILSDNQISTIPDSLAQLANLRVLHLSNNRISIIPNSLAQLAKLHRLVLWNNQISTIPNSVTELANLETLDLSYNKINFIPNSISQLANLTYLDLAHNHIDNIPEALLQIRGLTNVVLQGNAGLGIPDEILGTLHRPSPAQEILRYYFAQRAGSKPLNEAKLIMVGAGGVGKTSLVKTLTTGTFNPSEKTTEGIKIDDWPCPLRSKENVTVHIWDFGGQEMMHATHQFFLTSRSLYLLVLSRRQGGYDEEADYWLRMIRAFGGKDAPVIIVLNKQKAEPFDVNRGGWLEKYPENIKGFVQTDCDDKGSITQLRRAIEEQLGGMESLKSSFPTRWFAIKNELAHMKTDYISFENYRAICEKHGEQNLDAQNSLSGFLHDLGIALNYNNPRLSFGYVLKPEWVTEGIYALLHAFVSSKGLFSPVDAEDVLKKKKYSVKAVHFILGLMEQFELSFPLGDSKKRILIPELLADQQPALAGNFKLAECLNFGYRYSIVPEGLLPRFIVRTHHLSEPSARWKSGVILKDANSDCRALVRTDAPDRQVRIHVDGPDGLRRDLLAIVRHNFDVIHADYEFKPEELVYPPGVPGKPLGLEDLEVLRSVGQITTGVVLPDKTVVEPEIAGLIRSVESTLQPVRIFLSYSHEDEKELDELRKGLKVMERNGLIQRWHDRELSAGDKWEARIRQELNEADVIICQLSRNFLASDYCVFELQTAIKRKEAGEAEFVPYVLTDCGWKDVLNLSNFQMLPKDGKPLSKWQDKDEYWHAVAEGIKKALKILAGRPRKDRPSLK